MMDGIEKQLNIFNQLVCIMAIELNNAMLEDEKDSKSRYRSEGEWRKKIDVLSMRANKLKRIQKRLEGSPE